MKRLYKSRKNKVIDGVCGGIAEYFDVDPVLVRILFVLFFFFGGSAIIAYIIGMIIMPKAPQETAQEGQTTAESGPSQTETPQPVPAAQAPASTNASSLIIGLVFIILGGLFLLDNLNFPFFHNISWWFRHNFWDFFIPGLFILLGFILLVKARDKR